MAVDSAIYDPLRMYLNDGTVDLDTDTLKLALLDSSYEPAPAAVEWIAANSYTDGTLIKVASAGSRYYEAITTGISSGTLPAFPTTRGSTITDNSVTWKCWGFAPPSPHSDFADVSGSEIVGTGYVAGGTTITNANVTYSERRGTFTADNALWTSAVFACRYAVLYKSGTANGVTNPLICYMLLDNTNADVTILSASTFSVEFSASGILLFA